MLRGSLPGPSATHLEGPQCITGVCLPVRMKVPCDISDAPKLYSSWLGGSGTTNLEASQRIRAVCLFARMRVRTQSGPLLDLGSLTWKSHNASWTPACSRGRERPTTAGLHIPDHLTRLEHGTAGRQPVCRVPGCVAREYRAKD